MDGMFGEIKVHDFKESLEKSHNASDLPIWEEIYRKSFKEFQCMVDHRDDGEHQRAGIDRSVILKNSKQILIDEKIRYKFYNDIALEYLSNDKTGALGWVCKPLRADYICYAVKPIGIAFLLPVQQLQKAWIDNSFLWKENYPCKPAQNIDYKTWNCCVPVDVLFKAIGKCLRIEFTKC
jgi:hypothetical protein